MVKSLPMLGTMSHQIAAGDFNDDGIQDFVYGSYGEGLKGVLPQSGNVYIHYGTTGNDPVNKNLKAGQVLNGEKLKQSRFGWALQVVDFNLDGVDDLVVGAPLASFENEEVPVPFNSTPAYRCYGRVCYTLAVGSLNAGNYISFRLLGNLVAWDTVIRKGDIDLDGHADLLINFIFSCQRNFATYRDSICNQVDGSFLYWQRIRV